MKKYLLLILLILNLTAWPTSAHMITTHMVGSSGGLEGPELIQDPGIEGTYADYWTDNSTPTTNERNDVQVHSGTYAGHVVGNSANDGALQQATKTFSVTNGQQYRIRAWVYVVSGTCDIRDNGGVLDFSMSTAVTGSWQYLTTTAPGLSTGTDRIKITIYPGESGEFYFDDLSIKAIY